MSAERNGWKHASEQLPLVSPRQREILDLIERGDTNQEIADHFEMTLAGAKWHVSDLLSKLGLSSREEMAEFWAWHRSRRRGWPRALVAGPVLRLVAAAAVLAPAALLLGVWFWGNDDGSPPAGAAAPATPPPTAPTASLAASVPLPAAGGEGLLAYIATNGDLMVKPMPSGAPVAVRAGAGTRTPRWAPSGRYLAFVENGWLSLMDQQGGVTRLVQVPNDGVWAWSPAADTLVWFTSEGMFLHEAASGSTRVVRGQGSPYPENPSGVVWSPDGTRILYGFFAGYSDPNRPEVTELRLYDSRSGSDILLREDKLPAQGGTVPLGWSGDGNWVFYREPPGFGNSAWVGSVDTYAIPAEGGTPAKLGSTDGFSDHFANPTGADWVAFVSGGFRFAGDSGRSIRIVRSGSAAELPNAAEGSVSAVAASTDGRSLAYSLIPNTPAGLDNAAQAGRLGGERLWVQAIGGGALQLTSDAAYRDEHPMWSRDGQTILFTRIDSSGEASVWRIAAAGERPELVQDGLGLGSQGVTGVYGWIAWDSLLSWWQP